MKRLLLLLLLLGQSAYGVETLVVDSLTRNIVNLGAVNFATGQLKVNGVSVVGGGGGGGGGGGTGTIDNIRLNLPSILFATPENFTVTGGLAEGTVTQVSAAATTVFANITGGPATPVFVTVADLKAAMALNNLDNTSDAAKPISTATQAALDTLTAGVATNTSNIATLTTSVAGKADSSTVTTALAAKADITYVNTQDATKQNSWGVPATNGYIAAGNTDGSLFWVDPTTLGGGSGGGGGVGTVTSVASGNLSPLFTSTVTSPSSSASISYTLSNAAANTFFGNGTALSAAPTFMDAGTARTALGGSGIGQSMFTLTNPSNIRFPRFNADNTVSALDATTFRNAIGAGTVTNLTTSGSTGFLFSVLPTLSTTTPNIDFSIPSVSANTFYGNGTGSQAVPSFMTASTARTALGGTTVGQNLFQMANPSAITYPRISTTNTVTAATGATVLADIGGASTTDTRFPASVTGIRKSAGLASTDTAAAANVDYAKDSEVAGTNASQTWTPGVITMRQTAAMTNNNRPKTLPAANTFAAGTVITFIDGVTTLNLGPVLTPAGSDTINGAAITIVPFIAGATGPNGNKVARLETDGVSNWTLLGTGNIISVQDSGNANKAFNFDASLQNGTGTVTAAEGQSYTFAKTDHSAAGVIVDANGIDDTGTTPGTFTKRQLKKVEVIPNEQTIGTIGSPITTSPQTIDPTSTNTIDIVRIAGTVPATGLQLVFPPAAAYQKGETITLLDSSGLISPGNSVTVVSGVGDTFNGSTQAAFSDAFGRKTFTSDNVSTWTVSVTKTVVSPFSFVSCTGGNCSVVADSNSGKQNYRLLLVNGVNNLSITGGNDGMQFEFILVQPSSGAAATLALPMVSKTASNGLGLVTLTATNAHEDRLKGSYAGGVFYWDPIIPDETSATQPSAPSALAHGTATSNTIPLSWTDNANNEAGFEVWRSDDGGTNYSRESNSVPASAGTGATVNYTSGSLSPLTTYFYKVRAFNTGPFSNFNTTPTSATTLSGAPTGDLLEWHFNTVASQTTPGTPPGPNGTMSTPSTLVNVSGSNYAFLAAAGMTTPTGVTATVNGTPSGTQANYQYKISAFAADGTYAPISAASVTVANNAAPGGSNFNTITWNAATPQPDHYDIARTTYSGTSITNAIGRIGQVAGGATRTLNDIGQSRDVVTTGTGTATNVYVTTAAANVAYPPSGADAGSKLSVSFWIKSAFTPPTSNANIITTGTNDFIISTLTGVNKLQITMVGASNSIIAQIATTVGSLNDGNWHHVVVLADDSQATNSPAVTGATTPSSTDTLRIYIDGTARSLTYTSVQRNGAATLTTGTPRVGSSTFVGSVDDVRFYNHLLDPTTEIAPLFSGGQQ
jgi:Concanavalin A-like lectin/glucanases superfamily